MLFRILRGICLSTISHDAVRILVSPESTARGRALCKMGEFLPLILSIIAHESLNFPYRPTFLTGLTWTHCESESTWVESESRRPESESTALESESTEVESESESTRVESKSGLESGLGLGLTHLVRVRVRTRSNTAYFRCENNAGKYIYMLWWSPVF